MTKKTNKPAWKSYEESAMQTSTLIFKGQRVKADQKVLGSISKVLRQIDIKVGEHDFIDIECKDHSRPVDLPKVEQFASKLKDENAKQGIMISNSGFTESALRTAKHYGIKPVVLVDKGHADTSNFVFQAPIIAQGFYLDGISYGISTLNAGSEHRFSPLVWDMKIHKDGIKNPKNIFELFRDHWNEGKLQITQAGSYEYSFKDVAILDIKNNIIKVDLTYRYTVKADLRRGIAGADSARGFYDMSEGTFTSSDPITLAPIEVDKISDWPEIKDTEDISQEPFKLQGMFPMPDDPPLSSYENQFTGKSLDPEKVKNGIYT